MRIANKMTQVILGIVVAGILLGNVFPVGLDALNAADTSSWSNEQANIFGVLGIFLVLVPLVVLARSAMEA
jgi:hypothetical protein